MKTRLRFGVLVLALVGSGCAMTHENGPPLPGPEDGGPALPEDAGPDAGSTEAGSPDASTCSPFVDPTPWHFDAADGPLTVAAASQTFHVSYFHGNPTPCDGPCLGELSIDVEGPVGGFLPSYWLPEMDARTEVVGGDGLALSVGYSGGGAAWRYRPLGDEPWRADGAYRPAEGRSVLSVVPSWDDTLSVLTREVSDGPRGFRLAEMLDVTPEGEVLRRFDVDAAVTNFEVIDAHLVPAQRGGAWLVSLQDWDFPPTVQVNRINGPGGSFRGSSCGVDEYDAAELGDEAVVVAQRCGSRLEVEPRALGFGPAFVADDAAPIAPAVAVVRRNQEVAATYLREGAAAPTLLILAFDGEAFELRQTVELTVDPLIRLPITQVDIAASDDGTLAITWLGTQVGEPWDASEGALQRVRPCR